LRCCDEIGKMEFSEAQNNNQRNQSIKYLTKKMLWEKMTKIQIVDVAQQTTFSG